MTVLERPITLEEQVREAVRALRPGESFSLDRPITVEEFCAWLEPQTGPELIDGVIHMSPPPSDAHEALDVWLIKVLGIYVEERGLGQVRGANSGVLVSGTTLRQPDLVFFGSDSLSRMDASGRHGAPDFVVEIVDSDRARRDAVTKQAQYEAIGVRELWVADLPRRELRHFVLEGGRFAALPVDPAGEVEARTVPGFRLRVEWLFQGPSFPSSLEVVTGLLRAAE
jgi:Uma2 family endonuclease